MDEYGNPQPEELGSFLVWKDGMHSRGWGQGERKHTTNEFSLVWLLILTWIRMDFKLEYKELFTMPQFFHPWLALI